MVNLLQEGKYGRLEDFIDLANKGAEIRAKIELKKQVLLKKADSEKAPGTDNETDTYLLMADYNFHVEGILNKLSKVYVFAAIKEPKKTATANIDIANARLQSDYRRLKAARIKLEEMYF